jgi:signal transduction histidine kinase
MARTMHLAFAFALMLSISATSSQHPGRQASVLVLYGVQADSPMQREASAALHRFIDSSAAHPALHEEFVDLPSRPGVPNQRRELAFRDYLAAKYPDATSDLVVLVGSRALDFFEGAGRTILARQPIIACLIPANRVSDFSIDQHMSVIADEVDVAGTLSLARRLLPERNHIYVITGSSSADSSYAAPARALGSRFDATTTVTMVAGKPLVELESMVLHPAPADAFLYLTQFADSLGNEYAPGEVMERLSMISQAPLYAWTDAAIGSGAIGGRVVRTDSSMAKAAKLVLRVLEGERFGSLPRLIRNPSVAMLDAHALARWKIPSGRVPPDALVENREPSTFQQYRTIVLLTILLILSQAAAIIGLIAQRIRRRRTEARNRALIADLRSSYERIHSLTGRMINAQEEERSRIGRELHDDVNQKIGALAIALSNLRTRLPLEAADLTDEVSRLQSSAANLAVDVRELSHRLHSGTLHLAGLSAALQSLCSEIRRQNTLIVELSLEGDVDTVPDDVALCLYRVAQEGLRNVVTHAHASLVRVMIARQLAAISLSVVDDGRGFDVSGARTSDGLGLISLEERVHILNGEFSIESEPGNGTTLRVSVPLHAVDPTYSPPNLRNADVANDRSAR